MRSIGIYLTLFSSFPWVHQMSILYPISLFPRVCLACLFCCLLCEFLFSYVFQLLLQHRWPLPGILMFIHQFPLGFNFKNIDTDLNLTWICHTLYWDLTYLGWNHSNYPTPTFVFGPKFRANRFFPEIFSLLLLALYEVRIKKHHRATSSFDLSFFVLKHKLYMPPQILRAF